MRNPAEKLEIPKHELERARQEIASLKAEVHALNNQLQRKTTALELASADLAAWLNASGVAVLFLNSELRLVRFASRAGELLRLLPSDLGQALCDITPRFKDRTLLDECREALADRRVSEKEVWIESQPQQAAEKEFAAGTILGPLPRCFLRRVRPCRLPGQLPGVVVLLVDITDRIRSEAELRRISTAVRESSDAMLVFDLNGAITAWNRGAEQMYGYSEAEALGMDVRNLVPQQSRNGFLDRICALLGRDTIDSFEMQRVANDGRLLDVWISATWMTDEAGNRVAIATDERDITDRKRHLQTLKGLASILEDQVASRTAALKQNEDRMRAIVNSVADAIITVAANGSIGSFNRSAERMFGYSSEEILGKNIQSLLASTSRDDDDFIEFLRTGASRLHGTLCEAVGRRKDGAVFAIELAVGELSTSDAGDDTLRSSTLLIRDISERKELQQEVLEVAEQEQRRIGQDLHDSTQQELCGLGMIAEGLFESLEAADLPHAKTAARLSQGLGRALENVRSMARGLVPAEIRAHGLCVALAELARQMTGSASVDCQFECEEGLEVQDAAVATHLYRIAQEAMTNVIKHAKAHTIQLALEKRNDLLTMTIADDGQGISAVDAEKGIGLKVMFYRAGMIGGSLRVQPADNGGTEVICAVPV